MWVVDSGASHNMCNDSSCFISFKRLPSPIIIKLGDETIVTATFHGLFNISQGLQLNALYTPTFLISLLSINQLVLARYSTTFRRGKCSIFTNSSNIIANCTGDLYILQLHYAVTSETGTIHSAAPPSDPTIATTSSNRKKRKSSLSKTGLTSASTITMSLWHRRLAQLRPAVMRSLIDGFEDLDGMCDVCLQAKHKQKFIRTKVKRATRPFKVVNSDTCGPFSIPTTGRRLHNILFVDDYTRWTTVYFLPDKKEETCIAAYQYYQAKVDAREYKIKRFGCNKGRGEYENRLFRTILATRGTALEFCPPYAHHQNGVAERMVCTITEKARAMILDSQAPLEVWGEAINTAVYLHHRMPNEGLTKRDDSDGYKAPYETPYEMLQSYGKHESEKPLDDPTRKKISYKAPLNYPRQFGCYISRLIPEKQRTDTKLGDGSKACMMVGYVHDSTTSWRIWNPEHNTVKAQSDVICDEDWNAYISCPRSLKRKNSGEIDQLEEITEIDLFDQPQQEVHVEDIGLSEMGEYMDHGRTHTMSGTGESMSHGRTDDARPTNPAAAGTHPELSLTEHTNGQEDRRPPDTGQIDGHHIYIHIAPDQDADKYTEGQSGHCPTIKSHTQVPRDEVITNRSIRRQLKRSAKKAPVPTDSVTRSAGRARVNITELMNTALASTTINGDPRNFKEAMLSPQNKKWEAAIMDEYNSIIRNETFSPAQAQFGNKPIGSKWVFKTKRNPDGLTRYKARCVIKGYEQTDYGERYPPGSKLSTFRLLISLAARYNGRIDHLDDVTAFLNPDVDDDTLFMELPEGRLDETRISVV